MKEKESVARILPSHTKEEKKMVDKSEVLKLIDAYWKFDDNQIHRHTWHDKQDLLELIQKL